MQQDRLDIINILKEFTPTVGQEATDVKFITQMVTDHDNIFVRECLDGHLTASALVVNPQTKMILLHNHKQLNKWLQFGGHADGDTDLTKVSMKEAEEETGLTDLKFFPVTGKNKPFPIDIEVQTIPEKKGIPEHYHLDFRFLITTSATEVPTPEESESQELQFFSFAETHNMTEMLDPALRRLIKKAEDLLNS